MAVTAEAVVVVVGFNPLNRGGVIHTPARVAMLRLWLQVSILLIEAG